MSQKTEQILQGLVTLMSRQGAFQDEFPGIPFVNSEAEFGIAMGPLNGSLYAMHHLIDSLNRSGFFEGERADRTDLDSMVYEFGLGEFQIYDGVVASRTEDGMKLTINTERSAEETLKAITTGVEAAQEKLDARAREAQQYAENIRTEFAKEDVGDLFGTQKDTDFVKGYLRAKAAEHFSTDPNADVSDPLPAPGYLSGVFSGYGVTDTRPSFAVTLDHTEKGYSLFNEFHNKVLGDVFTGPLAVSVDQTQDTTNGLSLEIRGNPARLARDIVQNDAELSGVVAKSMGLKIPQI